MKTKNMIKLLNGVEFESHVIKSDFVEAQKIIDLGYYTKGYDVKTIYKERAGKDIQGTYKIEVNKYSEYRDFIVKLETDSVKAAQEKTAEFVDVLSNTFKKDVERVANELFEKHVKGKCPVILRSDQEKSDFIEDAEHAFLNSFYERMRNKTPHIVKSLTFENWKENYVNLSGQKVKLSKFIKKEGYSKELLDFYTGQGKQEEIVLLTISGSAQIVAGMSYYGTDWTSCQNPEDGKSDMTGLLGSLADSKIYVAFLHDEGTLLERPEMKARVIVREWNLNGKSIYVSSSSYYGNAKNNDLIEQAMKKLTELEIYHSDVYENGKEHIENYGNTIDTLHYELEVKGTFTHDQPYKFNSTDTRVVSCAVCSNFERMKAVAKDSAHSDVRKTAYVCCPSCKGSGYHKGVKTEEIDIVVRESRDIQILPCAEGYRIEEKGNRYFNSNMYVVCDLDTEAIKEYREEIAYFKHKQEIKSNKDMLDMLVQSEGIEYIKAFLLMYKVADSQELECFNTNNVSTLINTVEDYQTIVMIYSLTQRVYKDMSQYAKQFNEECSKVIAQLKGQ